MSIFKDQKTLFQRKINSLISSSVKEDEKKYVNNIIESLIKLQWYKKFNSDIEEADNLIKLQNYLGLDGFIDLLNLFEGKTIIFPSKKDFKETILIALCYYYKYVLNKKWSEIKVLLKDPEFPVVRYNSKIKKIRSYLEVLVIDILNNKNFQQRLKLKKDENNNSQPPLKNNENEEKNEEK